MAIKASSTFSIFAATSLSPSVLRRRTYQLSMPRWSFEEGRLRWSFKEGRWPFEGKQYNVRHLTFAGVRSCQLGNGMLKVKQKLRSSQSILFATSELDLTDEKIETDASEPENHHVDSEEIPPASTSFCRPEESGGKPGFVSFYNLSNKRVDAIHLSDASWKQNSLLWFIGPAVLVASFIFPSLYLRRILSTIFEDSLLTDFLILFFTEALFYCGVAIFLLLMDYLWRPARLLSSMNSDEKSTPVFGHRVSSVAILMLSLIIPLVTMGFVWPWTGPAASATLAPYLVGIVVQFAFEQYARYLKSPSWPVIPIIFQVYRLHQLNRATQLVTALSYTVRGAETTAHNLAINNSLGTLLNVLLLLGVICLWSLSSFLMQFFSSSAVTKQ
ncbi:hypothetical protein Nepgr_023339 [Nepenthes gracilis]|uniref:Uncharacterized protein n=1 Tax=Nepenthes gracilis TaxID=150966 RepID=A0AAD3T3M1_NEPGR|nr:hypothetical protein Nepgr_023339 [Nepenthes gracilis]